VSIETLSALLAAFLTFVIGLSVLLRDRRQRHYQAFSVLAFNLSFWYLASFFTDTLDSRLVRWLGLVIAAGIPSNAERFFRAFVAEDPKSPLPLSRHVWIGTVAAGIGLVIGLFFPIADRLWFTIPFFLFIFGSLGYCVYLLAQRQRSHPNRSTATRLQFLLYGGAATVFLAATDFLPHIGLPFPTLGNVLTVIYLYFISQTLFHYRLLDIKELLAKMVSLAALVLILSSIYGLLLAWVGPKQSGLFFFNTIVASFVILVIFEPLRGLIEERVNRWLFAEKYEFSRRLRVLARTLANIIEVRPLVSQLLSDLEATGRVTHVSVYLADPSGASYHLAGHVGPRPVDSWDRNARRLFFDRLHREGLLTREVMERERAEAETEEASVSATNVLTTMEAMLADVCIPAFVRRQAARPVGAARRSPARSLRVRRARAAQAGRHSGGVDPAQLEELRGHERARALSRARANGGRLGPRNSQPRSARSKVPRS
jgi:two-component system sensor histidine kinase HydH